MHRSIQCLASLALIIVTPFAGIAARAADKESGTVSLEKAKTLQGSGNLKKTIAECEKAVSAKPESIEMQDALIAAWAAQIHKDPKSPKHHVELGKVFQRFGVLAAAKDEYELALVHSPDHHNKAVESLLEEIKSAQKKALSDTPPEVDMMPYMDDMSNKFRAAWSPPKTEVLRRASFEFNIHAAGELSDIKLKHPSGDAAVDEAAWSAIKNASPLKPLPRGSIMPAPVLFTFDDKMQLEKKRR